jgi:hypothetical protein
VLGLIQSDEAQAVDDQPRRRSTPKNGRTHVCCPTMIRPNTFHPSRLLFAACTWLVAFAAPVLAQDGPISTDRPGFLFSPTLVPEGRLQVEAGLPLAFLDEEGGTETDLFSLPVQLRYGLGPSVELRLGSPVYNWLRADGGSDEQGFGDLEVGVKTPLGLPLGQDAAALLAGLRLPTGDHDFRADDPAPSLNAMAAWTVSETALTGMLGLAYTPIDHDDDALVGTVAGLASRALGSDWTGSLEGVWLPGIENAPDTAYAGLLATKLLADELQLDLSVERGLTDDSSDWILGVGASFYLQR